MGLVLPGGGDSASGDIIVPGGRRADLTGPTVKYYIHDNELFYKLRRSQGQGYLRHHKDHHHIVGCTDTGFFACLHCGALVYGIEDKETQADFVNHHALCRPQPALGAVGELVVAA